ncbi:MAG: bifunctional precorrin-2 dehydrogenase/sirohydrochlorin ferrochelatase [Clostridiaceae bacterium]|nr:bifunctional precorrin-2 dehydrogenase/sirohydrochlorin ferrochelatase [Clostridiaceae bacterium]
MSFFPLFIDLKEQLCVVAGGGKVACRKVGTLLSFGAVVRVVAPDICEAIRERKEKEGRRLQIFCRDVQKTDLEDACMVIAATNDSALNRNISQFCREKKILVNVVDERAECSFYFPSLVRKGELVVGVSSGGNSPLLARELRKTIEKEIPDYYGALSEQLGQLRNELKKRIETGDGRRQCLEEMLHLAQEKQRVLTGEELESILGLYEQPQRRVNRAEKRGLLRNGEDYDTDWNQKECAGAGTDRACQERAFKDISGGGNPDCADCDKG